MPYIWHFRKLLDEKYFNFEIEYLKDKFRRAGQVKYQDIFKKGSMESSGVSLVRIEYLLEDKEKKISEYKSFLESEISKYERKIEDVEINNEIIKKAIEETRKKVENLSSEISSGMIIYE